MAIPPIARKIASNWQRLISNFVLVLSVFIFLGQFANAQPNIPKFVSFEIVSPTRSSQGLQPQLPILNNPLIPNDPLAEQNNKILRQAGIAPGPTVFHQELPDDIRQDIKQGSSGGTQIGPRSLNSFERNLWQFLPLHPDSFSITRAVYLSESAFYDNSALPPYEQFEAAIKLRAQVVRQILKKEGLSEHDNIAVNYAIQKLYKQENEYYDSTTRKSYQVDKLQYDFDDYMGDKDWTKMFVTKLLHTRSGQCHSMPLLYLCIAEQLHAKVYLSLAPNHSFIQYFDRNGNRYNFETTNGNLVSQTWLAQSDFVNATALKNGTYLDTLSSRRLFAECLGDLLLSYLMKVRHYDDFSNGLMTKILSIDPANIIALMEQANLHNKIFQTALKEAGNPPENEFKNYPRLDAAFKEFEACQHKVEQTGFQEMPKEAYEKWLKSLDDEKQKQQNQAEQERMEREIKRLKNMRSTFTNIPKG